MEVWKAIVGYETFYEVSDQGRVRSVDRKIVYKTGRITIHKGRALNPPLDEFGYRRVRLCKEGKQRLFRVHVLVARSFIGPRPSKEDVRHLDGNSLNNMASNLAYGTRAENCADAIKHGTTTAGERHPFVKLRSDDVLKIRSERLNGVKNGDLAARYGVTPSTICDIVARRSWRSVA